MHHYRHSKSTCFFFCSHEVLKPKLLLRAKNDCLDYMSFVQCHHTSGSNFTGRNSKLSCWQRSRLNSSHKKIQPSLQTHAVSSYLNINVLGCIQDWLHMTYTRKGFANKRIQTSRVCIFTTIASKSINKTGNWISGQTGFLLCCSGSDLQ